MGVQRRDVAVWSGAVKARLTGNGRALVLKEASLWRVRVHVRVRVCVKAIHPSLPESENMKLK